PPVDFPPPTVGIPVLPPNPRPRNPDEGDPIPPPPGDKPPNALGEPVCPAAPAPPGIAEAFPAADPSPGVNPASGWPKNPFTVVLASPTLISRQSAFPVIGSTYCCRRKRILFVFSNCSIDPG